MAFPDARWTRPESWHLTLLFLGSVEPAWTDELMAMVDAVAARQAAFGLATGRNGGRLGRGAGVGWLGLERGGTEVVRLARMLAAACPDALAQGAARPRRTPTPHLTLARRVDEQLIAALGGERHGRLGVEWVVEHLVLYRSHLGPGGSVYDELHVAALARQPGERTSV